MNTAFRSFAALAIVSTLSFGCQSPAPDEEADLAGDEAEAGGEPVSEGSQALSCCDDPYTTTSYTYQNECRLDDASGRNELWRVEYQTVETHQLCCCVDHVLSSTTTEIYASNTHNTASCPQ